MNQVDEENLTHPQQEVTIESKYMVLQFYSVTLQVFGWILIVIGCISTFAGVIKLFSSDYYSSAVAISFLMGGIGMVFSGILSIALGQLMRVLKDTEENTRKAAILLERKM